MPVMFISKNSEREIRIYPARQSVYIVMAEWRVNEATAVDVYCSCAPVIPINTNNPAAKNPGILKFTKLSAIMASFINTGIWGIVPTYI